MHFLHKKFGKYFASSGDIQSKFRPDGKTVVDGVIDGGGFGS